MPPDAPVFGAGRRQAVLKLFALVLMVVVANVAADGLVDLLQLEIRPSTEELAHRIIMTAALAYALLMAVPFVPGVEIGLAMIGMFGPPIVFLVYLCTLAGFLTSFTIGRLIPLVSLARMCADLRLHKASRLLETLHPMKGEDRFAFLISTSPNRYVPVLLRHRYIALAIVINLPGNIVIGGGGGIALMAGASRLYSLPGFLVTIVIAVSPVPLAILLFGRGILAG